MEIKKVSIGKTQSTPIDIVTELRKMGYAFSGEGDLHFSYCRKDNPPHGAIPLLKELKVLIENGWSPQEDPCLFCRACGHWRGEIWCFHSAVFLGKSEPARPVTDELRANCPRRKYKGKS